MLFFSHLESDRTVSAEWRMGWISEVSLLLSEITCHVTQKEEKYFS